MKYLDLKIGRERFLLEVMIDYHDFDLYTCTVISEPVKIAVIGAGKMTVKRHMPALIKLQQENKCIVVSICDINLSIAEALQKSHNIPKVFHDAEKAIRDDEINTVCIFGPAEVHYRYGLMALQANKNLFVEKPPAPSTDKLIEMILLAKQRNLVAVAGFNRRFQKNYSEIKKLLPANAIVSAEAVFHKPFAEQSVQFGLNSWIWINTIHALDSLCDLMNDKPIEIFSFVTDNGNKKSDTVSVLLKWKDGRHATLSANNSAGSRLERYVVHGQGVSITSEGSVLTIERDDSDAESLTNDADSKGGIYEEFDAFLSSIKDGQLPIHSLESTVGTMRLLELIQSNHQGVINWSPYEVVVNNGKSQTTTIEIKEVSETQRQVIKHPSILVLNPTVVGSYLPNLSNNFSFVYENDLESLSEDDKKNIVAIVTGGPGAISPKESYFVDFPSLSALCVIGASVKRWGGDFATKYNIPVINTSDVYADAVAEFILLQALVGLRKATAHHEVLRSGGWGLNKKNGLNELMSIRKYFFNLPILKELKPILKIIVKKRSGVNSITTITSRPTSMLFGKRVSMIGYGEITKKAVPIFKALGAEVSVVSEYITSDIAKELGVKSVNMSEALRADIISMNRGLSPRTKGSFGKQEINMMKKGAVFINSGRAELVDTEALVKRLKTGEIFACIDVFDQEPLSKKHPLRDCKNTFLTPHIAGSINHINGLQEKSISTLFNKLLLYINNNDESVLVGRELLKNMT